jgi:UDP-glucose 4-epimerase
LNVLITGGSGFIGSHLVTHHLAKGDRVWVVDNLLSGSKENLTSSPPSRFDIQDVCTWDGLAEAVHWADRIYHMAAIVGQKLVIEDPLRTLHTNMEGCKRILSLASQSPQKAKVFIASSSSVYGHDAKSSYREDAELKVLSGEYIQQSYSLSKIMNEVFALNYAKQGVPCYIARLFNIVGAHQTGRYGMVIPNFVSQALKNQPITVFGSGKQTRSFCNVLDAVQAMDALLSIPEAAREIVNIGSDREISIYDLALLVRTRTNSSSEIQFVPYEQAYGIPFVEIMRRQPNLDRLRHLTAFQPSYSLEQTIDQVIASIPKKPQKVTDRRD